MSSGNVGLIYRRGPGGEIPSAPTAADQVGFVFDPTLVWAAIDLSPLEYVIVRSAPDATDQEVVAELGSRERLVAASIEVIEVAGELWRNVHTDADAEGWVQDRYLDSASMSEDAG